MASGYDWLDLTKKENQIFLVNQANDMEKEIKNLREYIIICNRQEAYIKNLEKHVRLLQKTLDVTSKNKILVRKVRVCGRTQDVRKNNNR